MAYSVTSSTEPSKWDVSPPHFLIALAGFWLNDASFWPGVVGIPANRFPPPAHRPAHYLVPHLPTFALFRPAR